MVRAQFRTQQWRSAPPRCAKPKYTYMHAPSVAHIQTLSRHLATPAINARSADWLTLSRATCLHAPLLEPIFWQTHASSETDAPHSGKIWAPMPLFETLLRTSRSLIRVKSDFYTARRRAKLCPAAKSSSLLDKLLFPLLIMSRPANSSCHNN